jgi:branched-chain amino acid transport system ATP-binding protein
MSGTVPAARADPALLDVTGLASRYGRIPALADVTLRVGAGELVAIVGANGAGKTTLLRTLSGVQPMHAGTLRFAGADIGRETPRQRVLRGMVQVPEGRQIFGALSVEDNLLLGAFARGRAATVDSVWGMFPVLRDKRSEAAGTLSGGQQQMLAIGRALMADPLLLLLDEPSMGLAPKLVAEIFNHIKALKARGTTILLVDQNARAALAIADRGYVMETGRLVAEGPAAELLRNAQVQQAYLGH